MCSVFAYQLYLIACVCPQLCLTLCTRMGYSPPGSSVHEIFQARILEWISISLSRGSSWPRDWTHVFCVYCFGRQVLYQLSHQLRNNCCMHLPDFLATFSRRDKVVCDYFLTQNQRLLTAIWSFVCWGPCGIFLKPHGLVCMNQFHHWWRVFMIIGYSFLPELCNQQCLGGCLYYLLLLRNYLLIQLLHKIN